MKMTTTTIKNPNGEPLLHRTLTAEGWTPVLATGKVGWGTPSGPALAAAEWAHGAGRFRVCQVALAGRTINPVTREFAARLVMQH